MGLLPFLLLVSTKFVADIACQGRIAGGFPIDISEAPYQVSIQFIYGWYKEHKCGGSILTPEVVVTSAHCTFPGTGVGLGIRAGSNVVDTGGQWRLVQKIQRHEKYVNLASGYDIAILFLELGLEYGKNVEPIALNENKIIEEGKLALVTGWGLLQYKGFQPKHLQGVELPIVELETCLKSFGEDEKLPDDIVCAGFLEPGKDACQGDSGGPLVIEGLLVGLVAFGVECASTNLPGFYTNVAYHVSWIWENIKT